LAISEILENRRAEATELLEKLKSEFPDWPPVYHALGECYEDAGNWSGMIQLGNTLQTRKPDDAAGWYLDGAGQERLSGKNGSPVSSAIPSLERAVALDPSSDRYHFELGKAYQENNDLANAVRQLRKAISLDPGHQRAHYVLARVYQQMGEKKLADLEFQAHRTIKARGQQDAYVAMLTASQHSQPGPPANEGK
jgi:predicted Zn-dependent protease